MKKILFILSTILTFQSFVFAKENISIYVNGKNIHSDVSPIIESGRTLVPVRIISENLGYVVKWDSKDKIVDIDGNGKNIKMPIDKKDVLVNGSKKPIDVPAQIKENRTFVPVRFIAENLGVKVNWDANTRSVYVGEYEIQNNENTFEEANVVKVVDGDTIVVNLNGNNFKLRMILVDTPETVHPNKPVEPYGIEASNFTKKELSGKTIYLQKDVSDRDKYNRLLRYVWIHRPATNEPTNDEIKKYMYNAILIEGGYGRLATFPPDVKYVELFRELDRTSRENNVGLWNLPKYKDSDKNMESNIVSQNISKENKSTFGKIKGNKKTKIYHIPNAASYNKISEKNIIYFDTEEQAIAAGYKRANNK